MTARALQLVPSDSLDAGRLLCRYGLLLNLETADYQGAQAALAQALAIARQAGDVALEMRILANIANVHWYHLRWPEVVSYSVQAIALARRVGESGEAWPFYLAATGLWTMGRLEEASRYAAEMLQHAERLRNRDFLANALLQNAIVYHLRGDWQAARDWYERGLEVAPTWYLLLGFRAQLEYEVGNLSAGELYLDKLFTVALNTPLGPTGERFYAALLPPLIARIAGVAYRFEVTEETASIVRSSPTLTPLVALDVRHGLALLAVYHGDVAAAEEQYTEREVAILRCLATGKSNKAIAAELFISPRTVNYHLKNIFFKTGAANRAEAAAFAVRHRLV